MRFTTYIKRLIYPLYIYPKVTRQKRSELYSQFQYYKKNIKTIPNKEIKVFTNREEDGIILQLLAAINVEKGYFVDIGSNDCINSNCANLAFNFDWKGIFIDADSSLLKIGKRNYKLFGKLDNVAFVQEFLYPENINEVLKENITTNEIDFISIDIDGNDYAIWNALNYVRPKIVVIENKIEYGNNDIVVPANKNFTSSEWGASIASITKLSEQKGYTLVATNKDGYNAFYMRNDCLQSSHLSPLSLQTVLEIENIKSSFYSETIMTSLFERLHKS